MDINYLIKKEKITKYKLSQETDIPYSTISDICNGKTTLENCNAKTIYKLASYFDVTMEDLIYKDNRIEFEIFKSNMKHKLKSLGHLKFVNYVLHENLVAKYFRYGWNEEALYTLAMLDYICRLNNIEQEDKYSKLRNLKLKETLYPIGVYTIYSIEKDNLVLEEAKKESIPEFMRHNIVENEVENIA